MKLTHPAWNLHWSERGACAALVRYRQNIVAAINGVFSLFLPVIFLPEMVVIGFCNFAWSFSSQTKNKI